MSFKAYPEIKSDIFYDDIYAKKEFFKTRFESNFLNRNPYEVCTKGEFKLEKQQEFVRNFISFETPYNGILLFHGTGVGKTCAAISITEGLRDYVYKMQKKIYIIAADEPKKNFYAELFSAKRAKLEHDKHSAPGSYQCAGNRYHISENDVPDDELRMKKIKTNIHKYYEFIGQNEFTNIIDVRLADDQGFSKEDIARKFMNSVIVVDEAHGITGKDKRDSKGRADKKVESSISESEYYDDDDEDSNEYNEDDIIYKNKLKRKSRISKRTLLHVLLDLVAECRKLGGNLKLILLSATPMKDSQEELGDLLELLNLNDGVKIDRKKLFPKGEEVNEEYLFKVSKGYISYVRGNNPISFPIGIDPPQEFLYEPRPLFSYYGDNTEQIYNEFINYLDPEKKHILKFNLYRCHMSIYQFKIFLVTKNLVDTANKNDKQCSGFVYPNKDIIQILYENYFPPLANIKNYTGVAGFKRCFKENIISNEVDANGKIKKEKQYELKKEIIESYGYFLMLKNTKFAAYSLDVFSAKFAAVIKNINNVNGICYCYCEYDLASAVIFSLCLEANGFIKYDSKIVYDKNGLPANLDTIKTAKMLNLNIPNNFRCAVCGLLFLECQKAGLHKFKQATYIIKTGVHGSKDDIDNLRNEKNKYGHMIKVLVGSKVTGEGIDLQWIRQIHIIDPWHNNTRIYQIIGRGIRNCSHIELNENERNVMIFKYSATTPELYININNNYELISNVYNYSNYDTTFTEVFTKAIFDNKINYNKTPYNYGLTFRNFLTATSDEIIYKRIINKDLKIKKIERILKASAIDCELNKNANNYWGIDKDYSRECDYDKCNYTCLGYKNPIKYIDIYIDLIRNIIKSKYFFGTDTEFNYINDKDKIIVILKHFKTIYFNEQTTINELIDKLKSYIVNKGARYDLKKKIYIYENPLIETDISTYNIHFAQPQIDKALLYIHKLFQHNIILTEKNIIDLVIDQDSLIDVEFIRSALDQMVGKLPDIEPKEMRDKYNRPGYILYVNGYYIFHPSEIKNKKIPIYYKNTPLKKKKDYIDLNDLIQNSIFEVKNTIVNVRENIVLQMLSDFKKILKPSKKKTSNHDLKKLIRIAEIRKKLDTDYTLEEQEEFYKYIVRELVLFDNKNSVSKYSSSESSDKYLNLSFSQSDISLENNTPKYNINDSTKLLKDLVDILTDYYVHLFLIYVDKGEELYLFFNHKYATKLDRKKAVWIDKIIFDDNDSVIKHYNSEPQIQVNNKIDGFYGFISTSYTKNPRKKFIINDETLNYSKTQDAIARLNTYIKNFEDLNNLKFKFNNKTKENIKNTFAGNLSKKSFKSGINCMNNTIEAKELLTLLEDLFNNNDLIFGDYHIKYNDLIYKLYNKDECEKIALLLKILDIIKFNNVRWFLSPFETEYFKPLIT